MKPRIFEKEAFIIAGVAGGGDEKAQAWEAVLEHPITVELGPTAISRSDECKFRIHL